MITLPRPPLVHLIPHPPLILLRLEIRPPFSLRCSPRSNVLCKHVRCDSFHLWSHHVPKMDGIDGPETPGCIIIHYDRQEVQSKSSNFSLPSREPSRNHIPSRQFHQRSSNDLDICSEWKRSRDVVQLGEEVGKGGSSLYLFPPLEETTSM